MEPEMKMEYKYKKNTQLLVPYAKNTMTGSESTNLTQVAYWECHEYGLLDWIVAKWV